MRTPASYRIVADLLRIRALIVCSDDPFILSSGLKCPMYCDNRLTLSYLDVRERITDAFVEHIQQQQSGLPDTIAAVATAGIPHAAWLAQRLELPMVYVRGKAKGHGRKRQIEGRLEPGQRTILLEDLVFSGESSLLALEAVRKVSGRPPDAVLSIFTYDIPGVSDKFAAAGAPLSAMSNLDTMLRVARDQSIINASEEETLRRFQQNPRAWSDAL